MMTKQRRQPDSYHQVLQVWLPPKDFSPGERAGSTLLLSTPVLLWRVTNAPQTSTWAAQMVHQWRKHHGICSTHGSCPGVLRHLLEGLGGWEAFGPSTTFAWFKHEGSG